MSIAILVGTAAIGKAGAINAALLAVSILSTKYKKIHKKFTVYRKKLCKKNTQKTLLI